MASSSSSCVPAALRPPACFGPLVAARGGGQVVLKDVTELSDSSEDFLAEQEESETAGTRKRKRKGLDNRPKSKRPAPDNALALERMVARKCHAKCRKGCKAPYRLHKNFEALRSFRRTWMEYHKVDQDQPKPPVDQRYLKSPKKGQVAPGTSEVFSFLTRMYESVAESLPDVRDEPGEVKESDFAFDVSTDPDADPYAAALHKKKRSTCRSVVVNQSRTPQGGGPEERRSHDMPPSGVPYDEFEICVELKGFLPPGDMREYHEQYLRHCAPEQKVSFPTFWRASWRVWKREFPHLSFRPRSSHAQCTQCLRHKTMISGLAHHLRARQAAQDRYFEHLTAQYRDRLQYWEARGRSQLRGTDLTIIIDGIDQSKFLVPRDPKLRAKCFDSFNRPKLHVSGAIIHGWAVVFAVANADLPKDANFCIEILAYCLQLVSELGGTLSDMNVHIQSDNTTREVKNNVTLRWLSGLVSAGVIRSGSVRCLRTGHSHEDIDQLFGTLSRHLASRVKSALTIADFCLHIRNFLGALKRPSEKVSRVVQVDQTRDWKLDC
ncbi:unnamed protein product [Symbiodinium sp. CCMP2592]|nr:unnamed protein product [Symbiodinium sp. CCMP2592]